MEAKFSNRVKEVISLSREEALKARVTITSVPSICLLGLIREGEGVAVGVLKKLRRAAGRAAVLKLKKFPKALLRTK
jgi:hypothetical protein